MTTNFFNNITSLQVPGNWKFNINVAEDGAMTVSAIFSAHQMSDNAGKVVPPMLLKGTAAELDEGFFDKITQPVRQAAGLFDNMEAYMKGLEEAKKQSKMEQDKKVKEYRAGVAANANKQRDGIEVTDEQKANKEEKRKAYDEAMKKIAELNDACKYDEALTLLPSVEEYPEKQAELEKKQADLERKQKQYAQALELFNQ